MRVGGTDNNSYHLRIYYVPDTLLQLLISKQISDACIIIATFQTKKNYSPKKLSDFPKVPQ